MDDQEIKDAMEMLGKGYRVVTITPPTVELGMGDEPGFIQTKTPAYVKISTAFKKHMKQLKGSRLAVWLYIALSINDAGNAYPGIGAITRDTGYSNREVIDSIREIEGLGYFSVKRRSGRSSLYSIADFAAIGKDNQPTSEVSSPVKKTVRPVKLTALTSEVTSLKPDLNQNNKPDKTCGEVFKAYESEIGLITPRIRDSINDYLDNLHISPEWIIEAIHIAAAQNKRSWAYCAGILKRWAVEGKTTAPPKAMENYRTL